MSAGGVGGGGAVQGVVDKLEEDAKLQEQKAWSAFTGFCAANNLSTSGSAPGSGLCADMIVETGNEAQWVAEYGRFADLLVVGRTRDGQDVAMDVLEAALMDTGKPLLIAPKVPPGSLLDTVVIAWKDTPESARAVAAAMPLIDRAARVVTRAGRAPVEVLLEAAGELGATLLVMGGYSHSRLREVVFGGFTQRILNAADLPVLMAH